MNTIYRPKTRDFKFFDLTKNVPKNLPVETHKEIRRHVKEEVEKSFNNMDTMVSELRRIAEYQGHIRRMKKGN